MLRPVDKGIALCFSIKIISDTEDFDAKQIQLAINGVTHVTSTMKEDMGFSE